ncbi:MAG: ATP-binding protein [Clostridiales bacterium]|nr:ATP-binding protein [Clostridiales bacterium]
MALTNAQYDSIMREYEQRQLKNRRLLSLHKEHAYSLSPRFLEINSEIASISVEAARCGSTSGLHTKLDALRCEREELLSTLSLPADYFEPIYDCPDCKDTGYTGNKKCHCLKQAIIDKVYEQSNIKNILSKENFSTFTYDYYSDSVINPATGRSSLDTARMAVAECNRFINDFDNKPKNLLFYGDTGVGKTFLSNCVANELLNRGKSVIYFTSFQLFDIFSKGVFEKDSDAIAANRDLFDCDLLIIDDLGTEMTNHFVASQFFLCVNERILRMKSTIISTNLGMEQLAELYSERTLSRILSNYVIIKLFGDDIRLRKRMARQC